MRPEVIIHSWKDEAYRLGLSDQEIALLPDNPAGVIELTDAELNGVHGGSVITVCSFMPCDTLITVCPTAVSFCVPTWGFCPLRKGA